MRVLRRRLASSRISRCSARAARGRGARHGARRRRPGARHRPRARRRRRGRGRRDAGAAERGGRRRAAGGGGARGGGGAAVGVVGRRLDRAARPRSFMGLKAPESLPRASARRRPARARAASASRRSRSTWRTRSRRAAASPHRRRRPRPVTVARRAARRHAALGAGRRLQADQARAGARPAAAAACVLPPALSRPHPALCARAQVGGVRLMSYGHIAKGAAAGAAPAAVMRGPMVGRVASQARARPVPPPVPPADSPDAPSLRTDALGDGGRARLLVSRPAARNRRRPAHLLPELSG